MRRFSAILTIKLAVLVTMFLIIFENILFSNSAGGLVFLSPQFQKDLTVEMKNLKQLREANVTMQTSDVTCGAAALATLLNYLGDSVSEEEILVLVRQIESRRGISLLALKKIAELKGYPSAGYRLNPGQLLNLRYPVLAYVFIRNKPHFVVLLGVAGDRVIMADPARGNIRMSLSQLSNQWRGEVLVVMPVHRVEDGDKAIEKDNRQAEGEIRNASETLKNSGVSARKSRMFFVKSGSVLPEEVPIFYRVHLRGFFSTR